jgi:hypothetical protein
MDERQVAGIDRDELEKRLKEDFERCLTKVVDAVDTGRIGAIIDDSEEAVRMATSEVVDAVDTGRIGAIIDDSEEAVRMATSRLRQAIFEKAIQMKTDAAEAAFSPSAAGGKIQASSQGTPGRLP